MNYVKADSLNEFEGRRLHAARMLRMSPWQAAVARPETGNTRRYCALAGRRSFSAFANNLESHVLRVGPAYCSHGWRLAERQVGDMQGTSDGMRAVRSALGRQKTIPLLRRP